MTGLAIYEALKYWLPLVGGVVTIYRLGHATSAAVSAWADHLLDNHMSHIQAAAESAAKSLYDVAQVSKDVANTSKDVVNTMIEMRADFQSAYAENANTTRAILTGIEILKDRG